MTHIRPVRGVLLATLLGVTAACGSPVASQDAAGESDSEKVYARFDGMPSGDRMTELVTAAENEGEVVAYLRSDVMAPEIEKAFESEYDVDLKILNPGPPPVVRQQVLEQARAGELAADLIETYVYEHEIIYAKENIVAKIPEFLKEELSSPELATEHALEVYQYVFLSAWNTNEIGGSDVPTSIEDFRKPVWRDNLVMPTNLEMAYKAEFDYLTSHGMSITEFEELFRELAKNASVTDSSNPATAFIASGQHLGGVNIALTSVTKADPDAPVTFDPAVAPAAVNPVGLALTREAPHPAAALLFSHWYVNEAREILEKEQYVEQSPEETDLRGAVKARLNMDDLDPERLQEWRVAYDNLVRGREDVLPEYVKAD
jgi:iron(III) transport system substrate-binding protein